MPLRGKLIAIICSLLAACVPYPVAYYAPPGQAPIMSGACNIPHSITTIHSDEHLELKVAVSGNADPTIFLRVNDASVVRFEASEISLISAGSHEAQKLAITTQERRGSQVISFPVAEFFGPTVQTIYSNNPSYLAPKNFKLRMPSIELNGRKLTMPELVLEKQRVMKLVGPCQ